MRLLGSIVVAVLLAGGATAQLASRGEPGTKPQQVPEPHRTRLILKDGSYQLIMSYKVIGKNVSYVSAERGGDVELLPLDLVDLDATKKWEAQHAAVDPYATPVQRAVLALDPELLKEEEERKLLSPEVAPNLHLAPEDAILALDTFRAVPELVPMNQTNAELNQQTGHSILRSVLKPQSSPHQIVVLKGEKAAVQIHVSDPIFYVKLDDALPPGGKPITVDTHGASTKMTPKKPRETPDYVIERVDVRQDARVLASFSMAALAAGKHQEDVFETVVSILPGGHWMKVAPKEQLLVGEYALVEILDETSINLGVWDFGIHPQAPENRDALKPEKKRAVTLEKRDRN